MEVFNEQNFLVHLLRMVIDIVCFHRIYAGGTLATKVFNFIALPFFQQFRVVIEVHTSGPIG